jgi:hypothetical protein
MCSGVSGHCEIPPRGAPIITPNITCQVLQHGGQPRPGYFSIPAAESLRLLCEWSLLCCQHNVSFIRA